MKVSDIVTAGWFLQNILVRYGDNILYSGVAMHCDEYLQGKEVEEISSHPVSDELKDLYSSVGIDGNTYICIHVK